MKNKTSPAIHFWSPYSRLSLRNHWVVLEKESTIYSLKCPNPHNSLMPMYHEFHCDCWIIRIRFKLNHWIIGRSCKSSKCLSVSDINVLLVSCILAITCYCLSLETSVKQETFSVFCKLLLKPCQVTLLWKNMPILVEKRSRPRNMVSHGKKVEEQFWKLQE